VTAIHKSNIMKLSDGSPTAEPCRPPDHLTNGSSTRRVQLVLKPELPSVALSCMATSSDLCAGLVGGLSAARTWGSKSRSGRPGSAPDIAGKMRANPGAPASAVLMLRHLDEGTAADRVMRAIHQVLGEGRVRTRDLGGTASTMEYADAICHALAP
jgi:isocitrate dehydrogenase (NAD+)